MASGPTIRHRVLTDWLDAIACSAPECRRCHADGTWPHPGEIIGNLRMGQARGGTAFDKESILAAARQANGFLKICPSGRLGKCRKSGGR